VKGKDMPEAGGQTTNARHSAVIYLRGTGQEELDDAERRCREYANRFGWQVLESIRDTSSGQLLAQAASRGAQIILTGSLDMISPDQNTQDDLMMALEKSECIVHPLNAPCRP
jgi:hypothetical protein